MSFKRRNSSIEFLRIVAIFMIIGLHYLNAGMGGALEVLKPNELNYYVAYFIESSFIIGVNLFVIITAYFLIDKSEPKISKVIRLVLLAYFYGALFYIISVLIGIDNFGIVELLKKMNIFLKGPYWFVIMYIILYLISPFINVMLNNINKNMHKGIICIMLFFFSLWPSFLPFAPSNDEGYGIITFVLLYCIGAYLKKYYIASKSKKFYLFIYLACAFITFLLSIIKGTWNPWTYNFIFNIIGSVSLFLLFSKLDINSKFINYLARYTFAIYLVHFNPLIINLVFKGLLKCQDFYYSKFFIIHLLVSIVVIFIVAFIIELIRKLFIKMIVKIIPVRFTDYFKNLEKKIDKEFYKRIYT